jgi:hypothetical protein
MIPVESEVVIALVVAALVGGWIWWTRSRSADAEAHLRRICFGDRGQVERLLDGEMRRAAGISRAEAARRALDRHRRDNR